MIFFSIPWGLRDQLELDEMIQEFINEEDVNTPADIGTYTHTRILLDKTFKLVNVSECYEYDSQYKIWKDKSDNKEYMKKLVDQGEEFENRRNRAGIRRMQMPLL